MVKEIDYVNKASFYAGADYGLDPNYQDEFSTGFGYGEGVSASQVGLTTDARTANQLKEISRVIGTGVKTIEMQGVSPEVLDAIPKQHFKEINRLKQLAGVDLTFHGPIVEPTGIGRDRWDPSQRQMAENQMWSAVDRAHALEPNGNVIVTFHSSAGLMEPRAKVKTPEGEEISTSLAVIDERTGEFGGIPRPTKDYLTEEEPNVDKELKKLNERRWTQELSNINISASRGRQAFDMIEDKMKRSGAEDFDVQEFYGAIAKGNGQKFLESKKLLPGVKKLAEELIDNVSYGDIFIRDSYTGFKNAFNEAYDKAKQPGNEEDLDKLNKLKDEMKPVIKEYGGDQTKILKLSKSISKGIRVLDSISPPQAFKPLIDFAVDKASETFSNIALNAYKKYGDTAPVISIENPPAGMGMSRADDLRKLVKESRKKFEEKLVEKEGLSKSEAKKQAENLIGATWDLGHINMIRKYGYSGKDVVKETEKIARYVKHVHLSDNFGMEHTELPVGMGNVPNKKMLEIIKKYNDKVKKIQEAGPWYQHFQTSPFPKVLASFGSPIYAMKMAPAWNQAYGTSGGYFSGYGQTLPEQHFNLYGAGFSNLPPELGGQMGGRSRVAGTPND